MLRPGKKHKREVIDFYEDFPAIYPAVDLPNPLPMLKREKSPFPMGVIQLEECANPLLGMSCDHSSQHVGNNEIDSTVHPGQGMARR
jgi:hypothetical protein